MQRLFQPVLYLKHFAEQQTSANRLLLFSCTFSVLLLMVRILATGSIFYAFLVWNLVLAFIPYAVTSSMRGNHRVPFLVFFLVWLLFVPNSFYIITDLFHLDEGTSAPQWFDLILIFSFAWNGLLAGILSLNKMEKMVDEILPVKWRWTFLYFIMFLNALGIYIGRYLRYNSWDVITNPFQLAKDILYLATHPMRNSNDWGMIVCFAVLMTFIYKSFKSLQTELR